MYPFLLHGMRPLGGAATAPHNLKSFLGSFVNLAFAVAAQLAGAVATPEFLPYMDYFIRKEYGDDYYLHTDEVVDNSIHQRTIDKVITDGFEQVVYCLNEPAGARNFQSIFWNIAYFDKYYFEGLFEDFVFPDGTEMQWESTNWLQKRFMKWFNKERLRAVLTFPVETCNLLDNGKEYVDKEWEDFAAEMWSEGHSFFMYRSDSVDSLASCCRLRNEVQDNQFSYTLGAGGISTGSKCVMTININRLIQETFVQHPEWDKEHFWDKDVEMKLAVINEAVGKQVTRVHNYLKAFNTILLDRRAAGLLPLYDAGFVDPKRQYLTVGINGLIEAAEFLGCKIKPDDKHYKEITNSILNVIHTLNVEDKTEDCMFNTEYVPAENLGVKNAKWDRQDGLVVPRPCYNSYFYLVEDTSTNPLDKFILHGKEFTQYLDGGRCKLGLQCKPDEHAQWCVGNNANGEPKGIPCQASNEEGVTTNGDECSQVHTEMSAVWKRRADGSNSLIGRDSLKKCDICGKILSRTNTHTKIINDERFILCGKHYSQYNKYNKFLDTEAMSTADKNNYIITNEGVWIIVKNKKQVETGRFLIDKEDFDLVLSKKWRKWKDDYFTGNINPISISRFLLNLNYNDDILVDHINGNRIDNRRSNLRLANDSQNCANKALDRRNKSGIAGVRYENNRHKWAVEISYYNKRIHLSRYGNFCDACYVRYIAEIFLFQDFRSFRNDTYLLSQVELCNRKEELKCYVENKLNNVSITL